MIALSVHDVQKVGFGVSDCVRTRSLHRARTTGASDGATSHLCVLSDKPLPPRPTGRAASTTSCLKPLHGTADQLVPPPPRPLLTARRSGVDRTTLPTSARPYDGLGVATLLRGDRYHRLLHPPQSRWNIDDHQHVLTDRSTFIGRRTTRAAVCLPRFVTPLGAPFRSFHNAERRRFTPSPRRLGVRRRLPTVG